MGLSTSGQLKSKPIYYHLYDEGLIEKLEFALWFGHNGGKFLVGGYDKSLIIDQDAELQWSKMESGDQFKIRLTKFKVGHVVLPSSPKIAFIDSGTTFAYMSQGQLAQIDRALTLLWDSGDYNCLGYRSEQNW